MEMKIGNRISVIDQHNNSQATLVKFDGEPIGMIQNITVSYDANNSIPTKTCNLLAHKNDRAQDFAEEMAKQGFWVEIDYRAVGELMEWYPNDTGGYTREKKPCRKYERK